MRIVGTAEGRLRWALGVTLAVVLGALPAAPGPATAQDDDWSLTREPRRDRRPRTRRPGARRRPSGAPRRRASPRPGPAEEGGESRTEVLIDRYLRILLDNPQQTFAFRRLLDLYRERDGTVDALVTELRRRVEADTEAYGPRMLLGHVLRARARPDDARAAYARAAELRPEEPAPHVALAELAEEAADADEARRLYREGLSRTRDRVAREPLLRRLADLALEGGEIDEARTIYRELARGAGNGVFVRTELARALASRGAWDLAVAEYRRVLGGLRGDNRVLPPVLLQLARAELETGEVEGSIATLERALRLSGPRAGVRAEIYEQMLAAYRRSDRLEELAARLRREAGRRFEANELLGRIEDELGHDEEALSAYRRALRARPRDIDTRLRMIRLLSRSGRLDDVVDEYRALIRIAPREPRFVIELAELFHQTDRQEEGLRLLHQTARRHPRDPALHQQLAELYSRWGEDELAAREVELLARIDPREPSHVIALGAQHFSAGRVEQAIATWRRVLTVLPDRAQAHALLAGVLADHDLLPPAIVQYEAAVRLEPDNLAYVRGLATVLERNRQVEPAEAAWRRVLSLARDDRNARREARERIVGIWTRTRRLPRHIRELTRRFEAEPPDLEAGRFLAEAHRRSGQGGPQAAEQALERLVELAPGDVESLLALERLRTQRGDLAGAIAVLRRLRDADPRRASTYLARMAEHALALYRDAEALRYAAEAVERNPDDASAHRRLGDLYRARQDIDRAVASYRRALELNERLYPVYFQLAELHLAQGRIDEADRRYRAVLAITPDDDLVARAARASIQIHLGAGTLPVLERVLLPLAIANTPRPVFRRMAVELYGAYAGPLVLEVRRGGPGAAEAREALRRIGARGIKPLLEALADPDPAQRRIALDILGHLGNESAAAPLLAVAENPSLDGTSRVSALLAAATVGSSDLLPRFITLAEGPDRRLSGPATWALARLGGREALATVRELARSPEASPRTAFAVLALGVHGNASDARRLTALLDDGRSGPVVSAALWALGRIGSGADVGRLVEVLRGRGPRAEAAAGALGAIGGDAARDALVEALFDVRLPLRRAAAGALAELLVDDAPDPAEPLPPPRPFEGVSDYLRRLMSSPGPAGSPVDLSPIVDRAAAVAANALAGTVPQVLGALAVLGGRSTGVALDPLTAGLEAWPEEPRQRAEADLDHLADRLLDPLLAAADRLDREVRVEAVEVLARLSDPRAREALARALADPPAEVRRAALDAIARSPVAPSAEAGQRLAEILAEHRDWSLRTRAAQALGRVEGPAATVALEAAAADDAYAFVREAAVEALGTRRDASSRAALLVVLRRDVEPRVRIAAVRALVALGPEAAAAARDAAAEDANPHVRRAAGAEPLR